MKIDAITCRDYQEKNTTIIKEYYLNWCVYQYQIEYNYFENINKNLILSVDWINLLNEEHLPTSSEKNFIIITISKVQKDALDFINVLLSVKSIINKYRLSNNNIFYVPFILE